MLDSNTLEHTDLVKTKTIVPVPSLQPATGQREKFVGFARDEASGVLLHEAFASILGDNNHIHIMDFRASLNILAAMTTPEIILIDLSGEEQPVNALMELADAVEAGTTVLAIGEITNLNFYRTVTRGMGIKEYLAKPLTAEKIEKCFLGDIGKQTLEPSTSTRAGRLITFAGARGGVGTTTIATNLAWFISTCQHRHTLLLDSELSTGCVGLNLNLTGNSGLSMVLANPHRLDQLLVARSTVTVSERLCVLAGQEKLDSTADYQAGSAELLLQTLRTRFNFVVADAGSKLSPFARDLSFMAHQRVVVMDPSMVSVRNLERMLTLDHHPGQSPRVLTVLNKAGTPGGLSQSYMEQTMGMRFDAVIPDLPRIVPKTTQMGEQAASLRGPFRNGIMALANLLGATVQAEEK